jgi:hypothetical protein
LWRQLKLLSADTDLKRKREQATPAHQQLVNGSKWLPQWRQKMVVASAPGLFEHPNLSVVAALGYHYIIRPFTESDSALIFPSAGMTEIGNGVTWRMYHLQTFFGN